MTPRPRRTRRSRPLVRTAGGEIVLCCWDSCDRPGTTDYGHQERSENGDGLTNYIFCSPRHQGYYRFAHSHGTGSLPSQWRPHRGLFLPPTA